MTKKDLAVFIIELFEDIHNDGDINDTLVLIKQFEYDIKVDLSDRILHKLLEDKLINSSLQWEPIRNIIFAEWK
jgi:hypothetical protein